MQVAVKLNQLEKALTHFRVGTLSGVRSLLLPSGSAYYGHQWPMLLLSRHGSHPTLSLCCMCQEAYRRSNAPEHPGGPNCRYCPVCIANTNNFARGLISTGR